MIQEAYLHEETVQQMKQAFVSNGDLIVLEQFLSENPLENLYSTFAAADTNKATVPDKYSYDELSTESLSPFKKELLSFVNTLLGTSYSSISLSARSLSHGDFTLIHDEEQDEKNYHEFCFFLTPQEWNPEWGGYVAYSDFKSEPTLLFPVHNRFCLINKKKEMKSFVKYVNHLAVKNRFILISGRLEY